MDTADREREILRRLRLAKRISYGRVNMKSPCRHKRRKQECSAPLGHPILILRAEFALDISLRCSGQGAAFFVLRNQFVVQRDLPGLAPILLMYGEACYLEGKVNVIAGKEIVGEGRERRILRGRDPRIYDCERRFGGMGRSGIRKHGRQDGKENDFEGLQGIESRQLLSQRERQNPSVGRPRLKHLTRNLKAAIALLALAIPNLAQSVHPVTGREIAPVMSADGAEWLDRETRAREERPEKAIAALGLKPGMTVGDVGAGTGYYSTRLAKAVAPGGLVYANDIQPAMLERLKAKAQAEHLTNIIPVLGTDSDPKLPAGKLDLVLLVDVYHEFSHPQQMLDRLHDSLKPGGELVFLEFRKEDASVPIRPEHKMSVATVKAEVLPQGYEFEKVVDTLPWQHIIFFRRPLR